MTVFIIGILLGGWIGYMLGLATVCVVIVNRLKQPPRPTHPNVLKFQKKRIAR